MIFIPGLAAVEDQAWIRLPAPFHGKVVDRASTNAVRAETAPCLFGRSGDVFHGLIRPGREQILPVLAERALDRHANPHPAVVVEIAVGQILQRGANSVMRPGLGMRRNRRCAGRDRGQTCRTQLRRDQRESFLDEGGGHVRIDDRQAFQIEFRQTFLGPGIGLAGIRVVGVSDELLAQTQDLQRSPANAAERGAGAVDKQAFRRPANAQRRGVAKPGACQMLDLQRKVRVRQDVDIDSRNAAADNTDATVGPARPCRNLDLSGRPLRMTVPFGVIDPHTALVSARLFAAGR